MGFYDLLKTYDWEQTRDQIYTKKEEDVLAALSKKRLAYEDFQALVSPAAEPFLEEMAQKSRSRTLRRFGKTIQLYVPLYLSNECSNFCVYCGFNHENKIERTVLNQKQVLEEAKAIQEMGFEHLLLVTGESPGKAGYKYISEMVSLLNDQFKQISIEVQPMSTDEYRDLVDSGLHAVYVYQETYNEGKYPSYHPKGRKANFQYRLETPERLGNAAIYKIGLGCLLGLEDWRVDSFFTALHLDYLRRSFWKTKYSIAFPRLRPHTGNFNPDHAISDRNLVQLICAYRMFDENVELSLSTRESSQFRDKLIHLGITTMSAGSCTKPGGYANNEKALEQFTVNDDRSPAEVEAKIQAEGYEVVWKDWDNILQETYA